MSKNLGNIPDHQLHVFSDEQLFELSDQQLYALSKNTSLSRSLRNKAKSELDRRKKSPEEMAAIEKMHKQSAINQQVPIPLYYKIILVVFPFFTPLHALIAGLSFQMNTPQKWKQLWKYVALGYLMWVAILALIIIYGY